MEKLIKVYNVDRTKNKEGLITHCVWLKLDIKGHKISTRFYISGLGTEQVILGLPWLRRYNPQIDWIKKTLKLQTESLIPTFGQIWRRKKELEHSKPYSTIKKRKTTLKEIKDEDMPIELTTIEGEDGICYTHPEKLPG